MIYLIDPDKSEFGHSFVYLSALLKITDTVSVKLELKQLPQNSNKILLFINRFFMFKKQLSVIPANETAHFIGADLYYTFPFIFSFKKKRKIIFTFHSCPEGRIKRFLMGNFCKKADKIIVHSDYTKTQFEKIGVKNITCIDYPSFFDYSTIESKDEIKGKYGISKDKIVLTALGGTRFNKGLDILFKSFRYIDKKIKEKIVLNIAGVPLDFTEEIIQKMQMENDVNCRLALHGLSDCEFMENVLVSDYLMIPYRKSMTGNSGPMTEAIVNEIPCIVSDYGNLGTITKEKQIGIVFKSESPEALADIITQEVLSPSKTINFTYKKQLIVQNFIDMHKKLYHEI